MTGEAGLDVLIAGYRGTHQMGEHLLNGARTLGVDAEVMDLAEASAGPRLVRTLAWRLADRRYPRQRSFGRRVLGRCSQRQPRVLLATGLAPLDDFVLDELRRSGVRCVNYLTDDPWNPAHRAGWFFRALPSYDVVFTPRRTNMVDLGKTGCRDVRYLPFGFAPEIHYPERNAEEPEFDVFFAGTGDADRVPYVSSLLEAGISVCLYGTYWDRFPATRGRSFGQGHPDELRRAASRCRLGICLVRRANRDGNSMRTFEVPAYGLCPLVEDTDEHREIFGDEGVAAVYFTGPEELTRKALDLLRDGSARKELAERAHERIVSAGNRYADRLAAMLGGAVA